MMTRVRKTCNLCLGRGWRYVGQRHRKAIQCEECDSKGFKVVEEQPAQQDLRSDLIIQTIEAIQDVRRLVAQLNDAEKAYLETNSPIYLQLVDTIKQWYIPIDQKKGS